MRFTMKPIQFAIKWHCLVYEQWETAFSIFKDNGRCTDLMCWIYSNNYTFLWSINFCSAAYICSLNDTLISTDFINSQWKAITLHSEPWPTRQHFLCIMTVHATLELCICVCVCVWVCLVEGMKERDRVCVAGLRASKRTRLGTFFEFSVHGSKEKMPEEPPGIFLSLHSPDSPLQLAANEVETKKLPLPPSLIIITSIFHAPTSCFITNQRGSPVMSFSSTLFCVFFT